ncbi:MAG: hypothetical protein HQL20_09075 [Candidatus Omnitrophica bacterium]|nr:hypothetical protein [Candidatus Omnitrophota bacterium]
MVNKDQDRAIISFFQAVAELQKTGVSRSSRYLGDIGEFLCSQAFAGFELTPHLREPGHDAVLGDKTVQVKFHNSPTRNNIDVGNPEKYDLLFVVIGPESRLKEASHLPIEFRIYTYSRKKILSWVREGKTYYCAKGTLKAADSVKIVAMSTGLIFGQKV